MFTTMACPRCGTLISTDQVITVGCEKCLRIDVTLYTLHVNGKTMTLCLDCIQQQMWSKIPGPSETKKL